MTKAEMLAVAKPILFNTEMVRAILDGRKTVTRRIVKPQPTSCIMSAAGLLRNDPSGVATGGMLVKPPYHTGDYLYVRETWGDYDGKSIYYVYRADYPAEAKTYKFNEPDEFGEDIICDLPKWRPSIHMPKEAARIFLRVTNVRAERLQDITEGQILKEGIVVNPNDCVSKFDLISELYFFCNRLWDSTIKKQDLDRYGWAANPWVWVIEFEREREQDE